MSAKIVNCVCVLLCVLTLCKGIGGNSRLPIFYHSIPTINLPFSPSQAVRSHTDAYNSLIAVSACPDIAVFMISTA